MAISFPASPSTNDVYQYNDIKYVYDGVKWIASGKSFFDLNTGLLSDGTVTANAATVTNDLTVDTDTLYVDSTNNRVGVGTSNPARELSIGDGSASPNIQFLASTAGSSRIEFADADDSDVGEIQYVHSSDYMQFTTAGVERMRLDSSGKLGIGMTPVAQLDVSGNIRTSSGIIFGTDTAAENHLDDYEEGTWTPTFYGATTAGSYTFTLTSAEYTKIGRSVTVNAEIDNITTVSAGSGNVRIGGLPFLSSGQKAPGSVFLAQFNVDDASVSLTCRTESADTDYLSILETRDNQSGDFVEVTNKVNDTADVKLSITYFTDA